MEIFYNQLCQIYIFIKYQIISVIFVHVGSPLGYNDFVYLFDNMENTDLELDTFTYKIPF